MTTGPLGEPPMTLRDPREIVAGQLDHYRDALLRKLDALDDDDRARTRVPSGWTPLGLLKHLTYVERRWLQWGFRAEPVPDPWGDLRPGTDEWAVADDESYEVLRRRFEEQADRSRAITTSASLDDVAALGGRFDADPPNLAWILLHLVQEYARHVGHLDIVVELASGDVGE
ncbi:DinB family protein [Mumia quercus]|uniref:DinB family protein n=1 Tax=Mumia quercus TaxID=2976125 RepID=UPI0021CFDE89|nr:DinB family protein [Mumia quercus]